MLVKKNRVIYFFLFKKKKKKIDLDIFEKLLSFRDYVGSYILVKLYVATHDVCGIFSFILKTI